MTENTAYLYCGEEEERKTFLMVIYPQTTHYSVVEDERDTNRFCVVENATNTKTKSSNGIESWATIEEAQRVMIEEQLKLG